MEVKSLNEARFEENIAVMNANFEIHILELVYLFDNESIRVEITQITRKLSKEHKNLIFF